MQGIRLNLQDGPMSRLTIGGKFRTSCRIAEGGFGAVYAGLNLDTGDPVAVKFNLHTEEKRTFRLEKRLHTALAGVTGIPRVYWSGWYNDTQVLVLELLGPTLRDYFNYCEGSFSVKTCYLIADQAIRRLRDIHKKGFIHYDIQPGNFAAGMEKRGHIIHLIDFGLSKTISPEDQLGHDTENNNAPTARFGSRNHARGEAPGRVDDLQSLAYMLVYFATGTLPWRQTRGYDATLREKLRHTPAQLCAGLPAPFLTFMEYAWELRPNATPDYAMLLRIFHEHGMPNRFDNVFDWTELEFQEKHARMEQTQERAQPPRLPPPPQPSNPQ